MNRFLIYYLMKQVNLKEVNSSDFLHCTGQLQNFLIQYYENLWLQLITCTSLTDYVVHTRVIPKVRAPKRWRCRETLRRCWQIFCLLFSPLTSL